MTYWRGFAFEPYAGWALVVVFFATGYLGVIGDEVASNAVYERARPVAKRDPKQPVYVTGKLLSRDLESPVVKPGQYLEIVQSSEVFTWVQHPNPNTGAVVVGLDWTGSPADPRSFDDPTERSHPWFQKELELGPVFPDDARISQGGKEYAVQVAELELPLDMKVVPPPMESLAASAYRFRGPAGEEALALYRSEPCSKAPEPGCLRVVVGVLPKPAGDMTIIGGLDGERLVKFEGTLKGSHGDLAETMRAYSFAAHAGSFFLKVQRSFCAMCLWGALAVLQRPLRRLLRFSAPLADARTLLLSGGVAAVVAVTTYLLHSLGLALALALTLALLLASRAPAPSTPAR
jgi:hypothetical protein